MEKSIALLCHVVIIYGNVLVSGSLLLDNGHGAGDCWTGSSSCSSSRTSLSSSPTKTTRSAIGGTMETASSEPCSSKSEATSFNSNSLVLYNPTHLQPFRLNSRTFHFVKRVFTIKQNWADFGVAAVVWDAAIVLCEYLESQCKTGALTFNGKRVVELGAGTGLVGMVAAALNGQTTLTDRAEMLGPLKENVALNFPPMHQSASSEPSSPPTVRALTWGKKLDEFPVPFDLILGADVVYIEDTFPDLIETLVHLSSPDSLVLLSCRIRYERDERFLNMLREGFRVEEVLHDDNKGIKVYSAKKLVS